MAARKMKGTTLRLAHALGADAVILDLEDAVSPQEKDAARILVRNALSLMGFSCQTVVRINALDSGLCQ